jgi:hypothetical protein
MEKVTFTRARLSNVRVITAIMRVPFVELLCQMAMGWIPTPKYLLSGTHWCFGHVLSCEAVNVATSHVPDIGKAYPILKALGWNDWMPESVPGQGGMQAGQIIGEILPTHDYHNEGK